MTALLVIVLPMIAACVICFVLGACWQAGRADELSERTLEQFEADWAVRHGDACPWDLQQYATPARVSGLVGVTDAAPRGAAK